MPTKEQLERWRGLGIPFDDYYDEIVERQEKRKELEVENAKIDSIEFSRESSKQNDIAELIVKIKLNTSNFDGIVQVEIDGKKAFAYQSGKLSDFGVWYANVYVRFSNSVMFDSQDFELNVKLIYSYTNNYIFDKKTKVITLTKESGKKVEVGSLFTKSQFTSVFGDKKLFTNGNMKDFIDVYNMDSDLFVEKLNDYLIKFNVDNSLRVSHFFGQIQHESVGLTTMVEFHDGSNYENRSDLGNVNAGDGMRFRGRGLIQLTGRTNYSRFTNFYNLNKTNTNDFTVEPNNLLLASNLDVGIQVSCWYWHDKGLNYFADEDDLIYLTYLVNGGFNGYDDRKDKATAAINILGAQTSQDVDKDLGVYNVIESRLYNSFKGIYMWAKYHDNNYPKLKGTGKDDIEAKSAYERVVLLYENGSVRKNKNNKKIYENAKTRISLL